MPRVLRPSTLVLLVAGVVHFVFGWVIGLTVDEAHYGLYAVHLDLSYFDHPPLVGWIQWPLVAVGAPIGVLRLIPQALWLVTAVCAGQAARRLHALVGGTPEASAAAESWAVACVALAPILHVLAVGLVPDTLLMAASVAILWLVLEMVARPGEPSLRQWLALGLLLGTAGLSKYTAIFTAVAAAASLLGARGWRLLRSPGPWVAVSLAVLMVTPVFVWNARHGWISFSYQLNHGVGGAWKASRVATYLLLQLLAYGAVPVIGALLAVRAMGRPWRVAPAASPLWFFALPFFTLACLAGGGTSLPHWSAPAWATLAPLAGAGLARAAPGAGTRLARRAAVVQALICLVGLALLFTGGLPWVSRGDPLGRRNPFAGVYGWDEAGAEARRLAAARGLGSVAVQNWTLASRIGWYARPLPVYVLDQRFDQYDLWFGDLPRGASTLLVDWSQMPHEPPLGRGGFARCTLVGSRDVARLGRTIAGFRFLECVDWQGQEQNDP